MSTSAPATVPAQPSYAAFRPQVIDRDALRQAARETLSSAATPALVTANTLVYARASDPNTVREYELTFVTLAAESDGQQHVTVTWASDIAAANEEIAERLFRRQSLIRVREVYSRAMTFAALDGDLLKR